MRNFYLLCFLLYLAGCVAMKGNTYPGMTKLAYCDAINLSAIETVCNQKGSYYYQDNIEVLKKGDNFAVFKDVTKKNNSNFIKYDPGNGIFVSETDSWNKVENIINEIKNPTAKTFSYDSTKYTICYGEMTKAHKARGFHQRNRAASIEVKEIVCKAYANGEVDNYEGKR